jgi:tetratricopeptide (TPR) repeat protein
VAAKSVPRAHELLLDEETQKFIAQSLTDVDLFASYGLTQKAIGLLEAILRRAPRHTPTLEKLLDFVLGAGDDRRTAELAAQLEQIHGQAGDERSAERFGELRRRFQRAAGLTDEELASAVSAASPAPKIVPTEVEEIAIPEIAAEPAPETASQPAAPVQEAQAEPVGVSGAPESSGVQEVDLSAEWDRLLEASQSSEVSAGPPAKQAAKPAAESKHREETEKVEEFQITEEPALVPPEDAPAAPQKPSKVSRPESEFELEQEYELVLDPEPLVPAYDQKPPETPLAPPEPVGRNAGAAPPEGSGFASDQFLADLANEIDQLGIGDLSPGFSGSMPGAQAPPLAKKEAVPAPSAEAGPLKEVFDEFRAELGEMGVEDEDLETHYNLGIAFREMGLLEEAISEFQKVAKASDRGRAFPYTMQCCTLLGLAFMEKGQPAIAAIWYERALQTPGMDPESTLALRYDLGMAQESAGEAEAALKSFSQVYAMNIDYRDVADRIAALQKPAR